MNNKKLNILYLKIAIAFILSFNFTFAQTKESVFQQIKEKLSSLEQVSFNYQSIDNSAIKGKIIATKDNKYKLIFNGRIIISDGKSIWNYNAEEKQVLISNFSSKSSFQLQTIFFEVINNTVPEELKEVTNSKSGEYWSLTLLSQKNKSDKFVLYLNPENLDIIQIIFTYENINGNYKIFGFKINPKISNSEFIFKIPKGTEQIDLR